MAPLRIQDIQTQEILMRGQVHDGLYQFSAGSSGSPSAHNALVQCSSTTDDVFSLWHKRLGMQLVKNEQKGAKLKDKSLSWGQIIKMGRPRT
ncbi:hypothetical protein V6Z11_A11G297900 [Gossypium hirsutum]